MTGSATRVRVVSIPARHPYVEAVRPARVTTVRPGRTRGWEPDPLLRPDVVAGLAGEADLVHLHFGFDDLDLASIRAWLRALADAKLPLVFTVHDLRNPHHAERHRHDAVLDALMDSAATVVTLTPGAADEIATRWGRIAQVIAHPSLVDTSLTEDVATEPGLVVVHLKSLRRNVRDPIALVRGAAAGAADAGGRLRVDLHHDVATSTFVADLEAVPGIQVVAHERFTDLELQRYLRRAHVSVLPYQWGTHSGWLELSRDLGTRVVAPSCGYYAHQWADVVGYTNDEDRGLDPASLRAGIASALRTPPPAPASSTTRRADTLRGQHEHLRIYGRVLGVPDLSDVSDVLTDLDEPGARVGVSLLA